MVDHAASGSRKTNSIKDIHTFKFMIRINPKVSPTLFVVDNFYENPDKVRALALEQLYNPDLRYFKGQRSEQKFDTMHIKEQFEKIMGKKIIRWKEYNANGVFQFCTPNDPLVYHGDEQSYAAAIYLTPDAPPDTGTLLLMSKNVRGLRHNVPAYYQALYPTGHYDSTQFEEVDRIANVYNRLAIWDAQCIHSAACYFGDSRENCRLFQIFFFDVET